MTISDGTRLFAQLRAGVIECPRCAQISRFHRYTRRRFDPRTQIFQCPDCGKVLRLGILAWDCHSRASEVPPPDTVPNWRQLLQIRQLTEGEWVDAPRQKQDDTVNRYVESCCYVNRAECPTHGKALDHE